MENFFKLSKYNLVIVILTLIVLIVVIFLALDLHEQSEAEIVSQFNQHQKIHVNTLVSSVKAALAARAQGLRVLCKLESIQQYDLKKVEKDFQRMLSYVDSKGVESISLFDSIGVIVASTNALAKGRKYQLYEKIQTVPVRERRGKIYINGPIHAYGQGPDSAGNYTSTTENLVHRFQILHPLFNDVKDAKTGTVSHVFVGTVSYTMNLMDLLKQEPTTEILQENESIWIIDTSGTLIFQTERHEMVLQNIRRGEEDCRGCHESFEYIEQMIKQKDGITLYELKKREKKLAAFSSMQFADISWVVVLSTPHDLIIASSEKNFQKTFLLIGFIILTVLGSSSLLSWNYHLKVRAEGEAKQLTEKRILEEKVFESEERYRRLIELTPEGIIIHKDGKIIFANVAAAKFVGATGQGEIVGKEILEFVHPDYQSKVKDRIRQLVGEGKDIPMVEEKFVKLDGSIIDVELVAIPFPWAGKNAVQIVFRDITERKRGEDELKKVAQQLQLVLEATGDGIVAVDPEGKAVLVNKSALAMLGYASWELQGKMLHELHHHTKEDGTLYPREECPVYAAFTDGKVHTKSNEVFWRSDGSKFPVEYVSTPISEDGKILGAVVSFRDISERKMAETKRRQLEQELIQAQKIESLGTLASGIAHDFNNILCIILGHASLLERMKPDPLKALQSLEAIQKAGGRGASLVKQLLTFARKSETVFESVNVNILIKELVKLTHETFPKTIIVETHLQEQIPSINADAGQLHQVVLNLCVNARDAMPRGGTLTITTTTIEGEKLYHTYPKAQAREYVFIQVTDTGTGMDESTKKRIFEPFFTTKPVGQGTGLGLSVVYGIIENHGGFIEVDSQISKGTTFSMYLPVPERKIENGTENKKILEEIPGGTENILLVEDEPALREMATTVLVAKGYTVLTANDGEAGVEMYTRHRKNIRVVITDLGLPKIGGEEVFRRIVAMDPKANVIIASGYIDLHLKSELMKAGAKRFIQKPYAVEEVLKAIRESIENES